MSSSFTNTSTFTIANARHISAKVKTDLKLMQRAYGHPDDGDIENYGEEVAQMLAKGYLGTVTYGYKRGSDWIVALRYTANSNGTLTADDRAGQIPRGVDISGATFYSYLTYSSKKAALSAADWDAFAATLPFRRSGAAEPGTAGGSWATGNTYSSNGVGVSRTEFKPW
ncbi:hypothetical protein ACIGEP_01335 [Microbacterium sp. NPDC077663]|uniref:HORMA-1 domain-containing protein n=1 Tax=Microbacterium sp. NPDC077663 TaxID=3364189 RepID=UPI0037C7F40A